MLPLEAGIIGVAAGLLAGMMGVGGGIVIIPGLVLLSGVGQHTAQGISLAAILVTGLVGSVVHYRQHFVRMPTVVAVAPAAVIFAFLAGTLATALNAEWLGRAFGLLQIAVGVRMLWPKRNSF